MIWMQGKSRAGALSALAITAWIATMASAYADSTAALARDLDRAQSVRAIKTLQNSYNQYSEFGLWHEMASLFTRRGAYTYDQDKAEGSAAIHALLRSRFGGGREGLAAGALHNQMLFEQEVNVSADGKTAKGRWREFSMLGAMGGEARWASGIMENEYVRENGVWKIARLNYVTQFAGPYEKGWHNVDDDLKVTPYHFDAEQAGMPVPPGPPDTHSKNSLAILLPRIVALNDEDKVRNLQNAYGYYIDRKMWSDVIDLFAPGAVLELGNGGIYKGTVGIRRALEKDGPEGLAHGQLNDHIQTDVIVQVSGRMAYARGLDFGLLGDVDHGQRAYWSVAIFGNSYEKGSDGIWRIRDMRLYPLVKTDFYQGWARSRLMEDTPPPDAPLPQADRARKGMVAVPAFPRNPVTGQTVTLPPGMYWVARKSLRDPIQGTASPAANLAQARRWLARSIAYDAVENLATAFGDWIADSQWHQLGALFAPNGMRQYPIAGSYRGPARIARSESVRNGDLPTPRTEIGPHLMAQPVIDVSDDARTAKFRVRLFQLNSSRTRVGMISGGMYANDQAVMIGGVWKIWSIGIDEFYYQGNLIDGWSRSTFHPQKLNRLDTEYLPDIPRRVLGKRAEGMAGGPTPSIEWPGIKPMWFHYKNPVSGRVPPNYWPDCVTCIYDPSTSLSANGY